MSQNASQADAKATETKDQSKHQKPGKRGPYTEEQHKEMAKKRGRDASKRILGTRSNSDKTSKIDSAMHVQFGKLRLDEHSTGRTKVRTHVNPLSQHFLVPVPPPVWSEVYDDSSKPLFVDVGCAGGRFSLQMASDSKWADSHNHLGIEIRTPLVERANTWVKSMGLRNVFYVSCSANASLEGILASYPGPLACVAVQFPDPHFKRRHHKRRVVQNPFLQMLGGVMKPGVQLFMQSDVEEIAAQMRDRADHSDFFARVGKYTPRDPVFPKQVSVDGSDDTFWTRDGRRNTERKDKKAQEGEKAKAATPDDNTQRLPAVQETTKRQEDPVGEPIKSGDKKSNEQAEVFPDYGDWLIGANPIGVPTEREVQNTALGLPIYRSLFVRVAVKQVEE